MTNRRLVIATILAGVAFVIAVFGMMGDPISGMQMAGHSSLAASHFGWLSAGHLPGLIALGLSVAAFLVSWRRRSYVIGVLLIGAGVIYTIHPAPFLGDHGIIAFPGPVVGLLFGHVILGLGVATGIGSAMTRVVQTPNK